MGQSQPLILETDPQRSLSLDLKSFSFRQMLHIIYKISAKIQVIYRATIF